MNENRFEGTLFPFFALPSLIELDVSYNLFQSSLSPLTTLKNLTFLYAGRNSLTGVLPSQLDHLSSLIHFDLSHNKLHGSIPSTIKMWTNLTLLHLDFNSLTGTLPTFLGHLAGLSELFVNNNKFSGALPYFHGSDMTMINVSSNWLTGDLCKFKTPSNEK